MTTKDPQRCADIRKEVGLFALKKEVFKANREFRFNVYLRFMMLFYLDLVFTQLIEVNEFNG